MSNEVSVLVQKRVAGSATKKSVLVYLADRASDDGSGIWTSKAHIAADTELSKRSVQNVMNDFEASGLIIKTGKKKCQNGYTFEYSINLDVAKSLPETRKSTGAGDSPVHHVHLTGAGDSPQDVHHVHPNLPLTIHEPSNAQECADDLFHKQSNSEVTDSFKEFWDMYPKNSRKANRKGCGVKFAQIISGKCKTVDQADAETIIAGLKAFIETRPDLQYVPAPMAWLNQAKWEAFTGPGGGPDNGGEPKPLSYAQRVLRDFNGGSA